MTKTIVVDGKEIVLKTSGLVPLLYKKEFKQDFFAEIQKLNKNNYDIESLYNLVWIFAKVADKDIKDLYDWLDSFETFPIADYAKDIIELTTACITSKKKTSKNTKATAKR